MLLMKDLLPFQDDVGFSASLSTMSRRPLRKGEPGGQVYALKYRIRRSVECSNPIRKGCHDDSYHPKVCLIAASFFDSSDELQAD
jgi:hypothetical protein